MHSQSDQQSQSDTSEQPAAAASWATPASHESVRALAHQLWEKRGSPIGSPETDWFEAERLYKGEQV